MAVRETSRASYEKLSDLGDRQQEVFNALRKIEPASDRDIALEMDASISNITPRRGELVKYGFVVEHGRKFDTETGRKVISWVTADPMAQRAVEKAVGKPESKPESTTPKKYTLKLKDGKMFTISEAMKDEVKAAMQAQRGYGGTIKLAGHEFRLANIVIPIRAQGAGEYMAPVKKEEIRTIVMTEQNGQWQETTESDFKLRRSKTTFRTKRIGVDSGRVYYDMMTHFPDGYETLREMKGEA